MAFCLTLDHGQQPASLLIAEFCQHTLKQKEELDFRERLVQSNHTRYTFVWTKAGA